MTFHQPRISEAIIGLPNRYSTETLYIDRSKFVDSGRNLAYNVNKIGYQGIINLSSFPWNDKDNLNI